MTCTAFQASKTQADFHSLYIDLARPKSEALQLFNWMLLIVQIIIHCNHHLSSHWLKKKKKLKT